MESETLQFESDDIDQQLQHLRSDRQTIAARLSRARWLAPGMGVVAAVFVASPVIGDESWRNTVFVVALAASIAILTAHHRTTGVKLSRVGVRAAFIYAAALGVSLVLLSVSYGLAAGGLSWWIVASAVTEFAVVTWLVGMFIAAASSHVNRGI